MALVEETIVSTADTNDGRSYMDWPAIFAGAALAAAISLVLLTFGSALGLSMTSAREGQSASLFWIAVIGGLWILWVQISASMTGGYLAGRMRRRHGDASEYESDIRDGAHGLVVWAVATLVAATLTYSGAMGTATVAGNAASATVSALGTAAGAAASGPTDLLVDRTLRGAPGADPINESTRAEVNRILISAATTEGGLTAEDRQYLVAVAADRAGITPEEAEARIDQVMAQAQQLENDARAVADQARRAAMIAAFLLAASLLIGGATAYYGGTLGGNHRDKQTVVDGWYKAW